MINANLDCEACGRPMSRGEAMLAPRGAPMVCREGECQLLSGQRMTMTPEAYRIHFQRQSDIIRARLAREAGRQAHIRAVDDAEAEGNRRITEQVRGTLDDPERLVAIALPRGIDAAPVHKAERIQDFQAHLDSIIAEAETLSTEDAQSDERFKGARERDIRTAELLERRPGLQARYDELCTLCRGGCCTSGQDHAHLTAATIRRVLDDNPGLTGAALKESYLERTPHQSIPGACIQLTTSGCALPREFRSDTCNGYFCTSLVSLQSDWSEDAPPPTLAIQRAHHVWNRYVTTTSNPVTSVTILDDGGVREVGSDAPQVAADSKASAESPRPDLYRST